MSERTEDNELGMIGALAVTEASLQKFLRVNEVTLAGESNNNKLFRYVLGL